VDHGPVRSRVILVEGIPGSGKTSLAEWLGGEIEARGIDAAWVPEIQPDHPVIDRPTMRTARNAGYAARCVERWQAFSKRVQGLESPMVFIIEGCLFQSTVRFLVEYDRSSGEIEGYLPAVERSLAPLHPMLVYLTQTDVNAYLAEEIVRRKGTEIVGRIARYTATTPFAVSRGLSGHSALTALYTTYRNVCDGLVKRSAMPALELDAVRLGEAAVRQRVGAWLSAALA